jgi:cysteinyl-tRNA synthetase
LNDTTVHSNQLALTPTLNDFTNVNMAASPIGGVAAGVFSLVLFNLLTAGDRAAVAEAGEALRRWGAVIGLFQGAGEGENEAPEPVQELVRQRDNARLEKDWRRADQLRDEILALGYVLEDAKGGTRARPKR